MTTGLRMTHYLLPKTLALILISFTIKPTKRSKREEILVLKKREEEEQKASNTRDAAEEHHLPIQQS
ncbi:hypothetical protein Lalb_Chr03g0039611 [Lupinus albus]|uniref:Uncharacterized protein n=1 Tax=Lupinus albus TaxID=3870 RepID=A0A6A4QUQ5_LUPAL|nr:hypothetical protein Lalb_Chr03g0039611 [Lupinus albus]